jgi:hypothetical protein
MDRGVTKNIYPSFSSCNNHSSIWESWSTPHCQDLAADYTHQISHTLHRTYPQHNNTLKSAEKGINFSTHCIIKYMFLLKWSAMYEWARASRSQINASFGNSCWKYIMSWLNCYFYSHGKRVRDPEMGKVCTLAFWYQGYFIHSLVWW